MADRHADANSEHMKLALHHAQIIQRQKDVESFNFTSLEKLIDYPRDVDARADSPTSCDMSDVSNLLQMFRPADFDELVEERRLADKCGYVLCPRKPRKQKINHHLTVLSTKRHRPRTGVQSIDANSWCSTHCLQRAAFVKLQLKSEPGWLRLQSDQIVLHFPTGEVDLRRPASDMISIKAPQLGSQRRISLPSIEKSKSARDSELTQPLLSENVVERMATEPRQEPAETDVEKTFNAIEGYVI